METNVGGNDRILRLVLGFVLLVVGILSFATGTGGSGVGINVIRSLVVIVGAVFAVTGLLRTCPINTALGINTYEGAAGEAAEAEPEAEEAD